MNTGGRPRRFLPLLFAASGTALGSCGSSLPLPPLVAHASGTYAEVPYPPPAALVEVVPASPSSSAVWLDGYWRWRRRAYVWIRGGWVLVPVGERFAPWQSFYTRDGLLMFAPGVWYAPDGTRARTPEILVPAYAPPNATTEQSPSAR